MGVIVVDTLQICSMTACTDTAGLKGLGISCG